MMCDCDPVCSLILLNYLVDMPGYGVTFESVAAALFLQKLVTV